MHWQESAYLFVANVEHLRDNTEFVWNVEITTENKFLQRKRNNKKVRARVFLLFSCLKNNIRFLILILKHIFFVIFLV